MKIIGILTAGDERQDAMNLLGDGRKTVIARNVKAAIIAAMTPDQRRGMSSDPGYEDRVSADVSQDSSGKWYAVITWIEISRTLDPAPDPLKAAISAISQDENISPAFRDGLRGLSL